MSNTSHMPPTVFALLATFPVIHLTEAYTGRRLDPVQIDSDGKVIGRGNSFSNSLSNLELNKIAEIRLRANENPEVYYETKYSIKFLSAPKRYIAAPYVNTDADATPEFNDVRDN